MFDSVLCMFGSSIHLRCVPFYLSSQKKSICATKVCTSVLKNNTLLSEEELLLQLDYFISIFWHRTTKITLETAHKLYEGFLSLGLKMDDIVAHLILLRRVCTKLPYDAVELYGGVSLIIGCAIISNKIVDDNSRTTSTFAYIYTLSVDRLIEVERGVFDLLLENDLLFIEPVALSIDVTSVRTLVTLSSSLQDKDTTYDSFAAIFGDITKPSPLPIPPPTTPEHERNNSSSSSEPDSTIDYSSSPIWPPSPQLLGLFQ